MDNKIILGKADEKVYLNLSKLNRHGFITGSTGSGKTVTLKVVAENLSKCGVPVFLSDVKGDVASLAEQGQTNEIIAQRVSDIGLDEYENRKFPVEFFDVFAEKGIALRTTISEMGPILLSRLLGLNETQEGVLNIAFKLADEEGLLLIDIKDLRSMLNFVGENAAELSSHYGNVSKSSIGAILRSLLVLEEQGGDVFFGEPAFDIMDFIRTDAKGEGIINILSSEKLFNYPKLYASFLLWLLSELYENLPEVGDLDKPKIVFFFDEAHLLFDEASKVLLDKVELIARLIRSKGVGIFFVTQKATDIPEEILSQLSNRIQHSLRAYTPKEQKDVKAVAESFRQDGELDLVEEILNLKTGQAVVSVLDEDSKPTFAKKTVICPPESKLGVIDPSLMLQIINNSSLYDKYQDSVDRESAYELLEKKKIEDEENLLRQKEEEQAQKERLALEREEAKLLEKKQREEAKLLERREREEAKAQAAKSKKTSSFFDRFANNIVGSVGREIGRQITRGIFGTRK